ncbi:Ig-like domain-containing protein, partial [Cobetia marina]|uniref:Ig-like domain-containing protein n=1 Tax=Cobetia marina TaxID=28258 RepID=UPI0036EDF691
MPVNAKVAGHSGLSLQDTVLRQVREVRLNEASDVSLDISPDEIAGLSRSGDDLVLTLQNGEVITLDGFYIDPQEESHLYLQDDDFAGDIYRIDMAGTSPGNIPYEAIPVENTIESAFLATTLGASGTTLAALGVIGATGLMIGGTNSGGGSQDDDTPSPSNAPDAPEIVSIVDDVDPVTGELASGDSTDDTTPTLTGTAEAGSSVAIYDGETLLDTVTADADGNWSVTLSDPLAEGDHSLTAVATDAAGNESDPSEVIELTVDTTAPEAPVLEETDGETLTGTGEPGSTITVTNGDGDVLGETTVDANGDFSLELMPEQEDGTELTATATDDAGNESDTSAIVTVPTAGDITAPAAPVITSVDDNVGSITGELASGDSTDDTTPTLTGTAEAGSSVAIYDGETLLDTVTADADGNWSVTLSDPLAEGDHSLTAVATDAAGNESDPSEVIELTVDTTAPEAPVLEETDGETLTGTGEPGSTITVTNGDGDVLGETTVDANGDFSLELTPEQEDGTELTATATDDAGNESDASAIVTVPTAGDITAPAAPVITSVDDNVGSVTGELASGDSTDDTTPTLTGTAEAGSSVAIYDGETLLDTVTADADGNWSVTLSDPLAEGDHNLTAVAADTAGNESDPSEVIELTVDTTAPEAPVLEETDGTTLSGTGEPGATISITDGNGDEVATTEVGDDGNFEITLDPMPEDGTELTATATDPAGNTSEPS